MLDDPACELCGNSEWHLLGQRTYTQANACNYTHYVQKRFNVLFDKWFPDKESVTLTGALCNNCGFIIYLPRPEKSDLDSKYRDLEQLGQDYGQLTPADSFIELRRSQSVLRYLGDKIDLEAVHRILDYGGGDGRLMRSFRDVGKQCYLVDYNKNCVAGVTKLCDTIDELNASHSFDLIICSHIIEHVAKPLEVVKQLVSRLNEGGHIFIEVPFEVWKRPPLQEEPVTHINFFTPNSLYNLMLMSGLNVSNCHLAACPHQNGANRHGVRAIGTRASRSTARGKTHLLPPDGMKFIRPDVLGALRYHMYLPRELPRMILRKLKRFW